MSEPRSFSLIRALLVALLTSILFTSSPSIADTWVNLSSVEPALSDGITSSSSADLSGGGSVLPDFIIRSDVADLSGGGSVLPDFIIQSDLADLSGGGSVLPDMHIAMLPSL